MSWRSHRNRVKSFMETICDIIVEITWNQKLTEINKNRYWLIREWPQAEISNQPRIIGTVITVQFTS